MWQRGRAMGRSWYPAIDAREVTRAAGAADYSVPLSSAPAPSAPPMGSGRIRIRPDSITTTAPCSSAPAIFGRFASRRDVCCSGRRCAGRRSRITEGFVSRRSDSSVPKSVSAEISTRPSRSARASTAGSGAACMFQSRTCFASWPACVSPSATAGDNALSTRNFTQR